VLSKQSKNINHKIKIMKKYLLSAFTIAILGLTQANAQQGFSLSVKATPQFSFLQNEDDSDAPGLDKKATFNVNFGIGGAYNFTNKLGVGLDVLYSLQGQRYETDGTEYNQKVNYLKIPVFFSYTSNPSKVVAFTGKIGPQLSILTDSKITDKDGDDIVGDTKNRYEDITFGGMVAAGIQIKLDKNLFLTTLARFDYDFTNAEDDSHPIYPAGRANTYNMTTGLEVGLKYLLK